MGKEGTAARLLLHPGRSAKHGLSRFLSQQTYDKRRRRNAVGGVFRRDDARHPAHQSTTPARLSRHHDIVREHRPAHSHRYGVVWKHFLAGSKRVHHCRQISRGLRLRPRSQQGGARCTLRPAGRRQLRLRLSECPTARVQGRGASGYPTHLLRAPTDGTRHRSRMDHHSQESHGKRSARVAE